MVAVRSIHARHPDLESATADERAFVLLAKLMVDSAQQLHSLISAYDQMARGRVGCSGTGDDDL